MAVAWSPSPRTFCGRAARAACTLPCPFSCPQSRSCSPAGSSSSLGAAVPTGGEFVCVGGSVSARTACRGLTPGARLERFTRLCRDSGPSPSRLTEGCRGTSGGGSGGREGSSVAGVKSGEKTLAGAEPTRGLSPPCSPGAGGAVGGGNGRPPLLLPPRPPAPAPTSGCYWSSPCSRRRLGTYKPRSRLPPNRVGPGAVPPAPTMRGEVDRAGIRPVRGEPGD